MSKARTRGSREPANDSRRGKIALESTPKPANRLAYRLLVCLLLAAVTFAVFWPVTGFDFVYTDDTFYVTHNAQVLRGLSPESVRWAFGTLHAANWHPVTWLAHMLDVTLFGLRPGAHHLMNVVFHASNAVLLFAWLWRMTRAFWRSALVAALFALHPLHVESVAWVSERKDVLSTFFGFLSLLYYAGYAKQKAAERKSAGAGGKNAPSFNYWLALVFFALGLMSKPMLVTWPFLMLLLDYWPLRRFEPLTPNSRLSTGWRLVQEKIPFLVLSLASSVVTVIAQKHGQAVLTLEQLPFNERLQNAVISYARYLGKAFWPANLVVPYPFPEQWPAWEVVLSLLLIIGLGAAAFGLRRRWPFLLVGWFLFVGTLVPVIGLLQVGSQSMADRYTYLPLVGIFIAVVWGVGEAQSRWRVPKTLTVPGAGLVLAACVIVTRNQLSYWQNSETLIRHTIAASKNNAFAYYDLGCYLEDMGQVAAAMDNYRMAIQLRPTYAKPLNNIGKILADEGHLDGAIDYYSRALHLDPEHVATLNNLGAALAEKRQFTDAMAMYEKALRLDPNFVYARYNLGIALETQGRWEEALAQYAEVLRVKPDYWQAHNNLGSLLMLHGRLNEAIDHFTESLRLNANQPNIDFNLGNTLAMQQKYEEAVLHFTECLKLSPDYAPAHKNLGMALLRLGRREEAINHLNEAVRLKPDYKEAIQQLRALDAQKGE